jgi:hypothetical protein
MVKFKNAISSKDRTKLFFLSTSIGRAKNGGWG